MTEEQILNDGKCPRCQTPYGDLPYCYRCAQKRLAWLGLATFLITPILGFGACLSQFDLHGPTTPLVRFGMILFFVGPLVGIVMMIVAFVRMRR